MGLEIDFLSVGDSEKSGDAIALRWGNLDGPRGEQMVVIVDGGFADDGQALVDHLATHYNTARADIVIATHPDQDHVNGLKVVLNSIAVGQLCMHRPWNRSNEVLLAKTSGFNATTWSQKFAKNFEAASELEAIANQKGIEIIEPWAGASTPDGVLTILSPTEAYYQQLLGEITKQQSSLAALLGQLTGAAGTAVNKAAEKLVPEDWLAETLTDWGETSPQNNTSVICLLQYDGHTALLTADAGMPALEMAADTLEQMGLAPGKLDFVQVPHHGSRRNVGPTVLDRILGPKGQTQRIGTAFVSASPKAEKHPAKKVTNAFLRRGYPVHGADGEHKRHHHKAPPRGGYSTSTPHAMHSQVEDDEG